MAGAQDRGGGAEATAFAAEGAATVHEATGGIGALSKVSLRKRRTRQPMINNCRYILMSYISGS